MSIESQQSLPLLPLRNGVFFPGGVITLNVGRPKSIALIKAADPTETLLAIVTQKDPEIEDPSEEDLYRIGTLARILKIQKNWPQHLQPDGPRYPAHRIGTHPHG